MPAHLASVMRRTDIPATRRYRLVHRSAIVAGAALAAGLLLGGCDSSSFTEPTAADAGSRDHRAPGNVDESGVTAVVAAWDAAWNAGDAAGLAALFVADAEFINGRGQVARGAALIGAQHAALLAGPFQGSRSASRVRSVTFLSTTAAVVDVDCELTGFRSPPPGAVFTEPGLNRGRHKRVVVRQGGAWRIQSMQITTVAPAP